MDLSSLNVGYSAVVSAIRSFTNDDPVARRLMELGFLPGAKIAKLHVAPLFGEPATFMVRGTQVALRKDEARRVEVDAVSLHHLAATSR